MESRLSIFQKGLILVLIPLLTQGMFLGVLFKIRRDQAEAQGLALHAHEVIAETDSVFGTLAETHSALRGYLITDNPDLAQKYLGAQTRLAHEIEALEHLTADNPSQTSRLRRIDDTSRELFRWFNDLYHLIRNGQHENAVNLVKGLRGQRLVDDVQRQLSEFLQVEEQLQAERMQALSHQADLQNVVLYGGGVLALFSTALLGMMFASGIANRLNVLSENARRLAEGKELHRPLTGADELSQLDRAFRDMAAALAQKSQENEMFVYSVSHDLRSPLVNLQGFSMELATSARELRALVADAPLAPGVKEEAATLIDRNMAESIHFIHNAVVRLSAIIDALLRLSRAGRVEYRWQAIDVSATVCRVVEALQNTLSQKNAHVETHDLPGAWGDPTAVEQVFGNLIGNAVNYLDPARPGIIEVGAVPAAADSSLEQRTFYVKDNGLGIPEAHQAKVFIAFQRLHPEAAKGEGIGLALVRRIVERHGGRIWLESEPGVGTTFYISLPATPPGVTASGPVLQAVVS
jgi:signal transduction histidine kinase